MDELRVILLVVGALVIAGVYAYSRRAVQRQPGDDDVFPAREPQLGGHDDDDVLDDLPPLRASAAPEGDSGDDTESADEYDAAVSPEEKIIVLNIMPHVPDETFPGADLLDVFDRAGLEYGQYGVFHRMKETARGPVSVFSVASATEPGSFDITSMADARFRGLSLFMLLPGPVRGVDAFADMLATARRVAEQIRGDVKDRNRSTLTRQTAHHIREEIIAFEHRQQIKG